MPDIRKGCLPAGDWLYNPFFDPEVQVALEHKRTLPAKCPKHQHLLKGNVQLTVPNPHHRKDIGVQLLKLALNEAGISREDWFNAR